MTTNFIMFLIFSFVIVIFSILSVTSRKILRAAVYLLFVLVSTAGLYFMLSYNFLAAVQLTLYAGGIVVLIVFSILLTSHIDHKFELVTLKKSIFSGIAAILGAVLVITTILQYKFEPFANKTAMNTDVSTIGFKMISYEKYGYALPFEVISILLLAAMIGSIIIARKEN